MLFPEITSERMIEMKKLIVLGVCAAMAFSMAACANQKEPSSTTEPSSQMQLPNPFTSCETMADAEKIAGFTLTMPEHAPDWAAETTIRATRSGMIEVVHLGNGSEMRIRKAAGNEDISGDYSAYQTSNEISVGDTNVQVKGNEEKIYLATWSNGTYSYSISVNSGLVQEEITSLISSID